VFGNSVNSGIKIMKLRHLEAPYIGWFHLGSEEARRAGEVLRRLDAVEDSVDELGFGILRDGFAEQFFPGTSTVMTEVRYLLLIARIYRHIESCLKNKPRSIHDPRRKSREMQDQMRDVLCDSYGRRRGNGIIGLRVQEPVRYPSDIYWSSLKRLGIFLLKHDSESDYQQRLAQYRDQPPLLTDESKSPITNDEQGAHWDSGLPFPEDVDNALAENGTFLSGLRFELSQPEAIYLRDCYLGSADRKVEDGIKNSLLAHLIRQRRKARFWFPWDVSGPKVLEQAIDDAKHLSALVQGAMLQYYWWLIRGREEMGLDLPGVDVEGAFAFWWENGRPLVVDPDYSWDAFIQRRARDLRVQRRDAWFLAEWTGHCHSARRPASFLSDGGVRTLIVDRERLCKPGKARLTHDKHLKTWGLGFTLKQGEAFSLNYRSPIGYNFVARIVAGLAEDT
jgi:hypothetical protein